MSLRSTMWIGFAGAVLLTFVSGASAALEVIVPAEMQIGTTDSSSTDVTWWGWIIPMSDPLSESDLDAVTTGVINDPQVTVHPQFFLNTDLLSPLPPGEVAGERLVGGNAAAYDPLLYPGESLKLPDIAFWQAGFEYPFGYVATATFTASITIDGQTLPYSTLVHFGDFDTQVIQGQRIPEPGMLSLGIAGSFLLIRKKRRRIPKIVLDK